MTFDAFAASERSLRAGKTDTDCCDMWICTASARYAQARVGTAKHLTNPMRDRPTVG